MKDNETIGIIIDHDEDYIYPICPHCGEEESLPIDEQRHHLKMFNLDKWLTDEVSKMSCNSCKGVFTITWKYDETVNNPIL